VVNKGGIVQIN